MVANGDTPVLILTGPPGAGKTTVARALAEHFEPAVHVESDRFFHFIASGYVDPWRPESHEQNRLVMRIVALAASAYAAAGYFTVVDGIILPRFFFEPLRDGLRAAGHTVAYAVLRAPLDVCSARAASRGDRPLGEPEVVTRLWNQFADLGSLEAHAVEPGNRAAGDTAELLAGRLRDGSLLVGRQ